MAEQQGSGGYLLIDTGYPEKSMPIGCSPPS